MKETHLSIDLDDGNRISAILARPGDETPARDTGIAVAHGAANDMNHDLIREFARGMALRGFPCLRFNFSYREKQKKSIDPEHRLLQAWAAALDRLKTETGCPGTVAAGKSLGARMAAQGTVQGVIAPRGLIFMGYPLHAPGKKDALRDAPLYAIKIPMLFFEGTRDPFCDMGRFNGVYAKISAPKALTTIENGDHGFGLPKSDPRTPADITGTIVRDSEAWLLGHGIT